MFRDEFRGVHGHFFLASKSDSPRALETFLADIRLDGDVEATRNDNGSEFAGSMSRLCNKYIVGREFRNGTLQQNGNVERAFGIIDSMQMGGR